MKTKTTFWLIGMLCVSLSTGLGMLKGAESEAIQENTQEQMVHGMPQSTATTTLGYDEYSDWIIYQNWSWASYPGGLQESGKVVWEFEGSNTIVGITAIAMDEENFLEFTRGHNYTSYILSSGANYYDTGAFEIPYSDIWWFIFLNNDTDEETTNIVYSTFYLGPLQEDGFEENDYSTEARLITEGNYPDLACLDVDWFSIEVTASDRLTVDIFFLHFAGDLNLELFDESGALQASSESLTNNEQVSKEINYTGIVYIRIYMVDDFSQNSYDLTIDLSLDDDVFEENDESTEAAVITEGYYPHLWCGDEDWFQINVNAGNKLWVNLTFLHSEGDLNLGLSDETGNLQANFQSTTDNERASIDIDFTGVVYIKVYMFDDPNFYDLTIEIISSETDLNPDEIPGFAGVYLGIFTLMGIALLIFRKRR